MIKIKYLPASLVRAPLCALLLLAGCTYKGENPRIDGQSVQLTILQTSDIHARLLPYDMDVGMVDQSLGLNPANAPFGGAARVSHIIKRERAKAGRVLYIDCGDPFQGAPIFNYFKGEPEIRSLSEMGVNVMVIGNHEFDRGADNLARQLDDWANFTPLAANYDFRDPNFPGVNNLGRLVKPFVIYNLGGLKVGVIGIGDTTTINTILESGNKYGITPLILYETVQFYVNLLRPQVNFIIVATHQGLTLDEKMIERTSGIDLVLGGHLHIVLNPSKRLQDCAHGRDGLGNPCTPHTVILSHAGAFAKYVGRIDLVLMQTDPADRNNWEAVSSDLTLFPVDSTVPEDPVVVDLLLPYTWRMEQLLNKDQIIGYAPTDVKRFGAGGGDSQLGNLVATAMWLRTGIETDLAFTNTTGIRSDLPAGPITVEQIVNVFPFDNTIATMFVTGSDLIELFDYSSYRTAIRGCKSQVQVAGMTMKVRCGSCPDGQFGCVEELQPGPDYARELFIGSEGARVEKYGVYEMATNDYLAGGGSGYSMLRRNTSQVNSGIPMRDALIDYIKGGRPCIEPTSCTADAECPGGAVCGCEGMWWWDDANVQCRSDGLCASDSGPHCVLAQCVDDLAAFYLSREGQDTYEDAGQQGCLWRNWAAEECSRIACVGKAGGATCAAASDCVDNPSCPGTVMCCKASGGTDAQTGYCSCPEVCDPVWATGLEDGRIQILTD
jgi:5'-nucleotidase/UDP-sugar diphosphatase